MVSLENHVQHLEQVQNAQTSQVSIMQLQLEEFEDRNRRQNFRFRGIPEAIGRDVLETTVLAICQQLAIPPLPRVWNLREFIELWAPLQ